MGKLQIDFATPMDMVARESSDTHALGADARKIMARFVEYGCQDLTAQINIDSEYHKGIVFAQGKVFDVYRAHLVEWTRVALKKTDRDLHAEEWETEYIKGLACEILQLARIKHPNVLELFGIAGFTKHLLLISPWMENGTLPRYIKRNPEVDRLQLCSQVAAGVAYIHSLDMAFGNISGANILMSSEGVPKLILNPHILREHPNTQTMPLKRLGWRWTAPEYFKGLPYTKEGDMWVLALTFVEIITGAVPFNNIPEEKMIQVAATGQTPSRPDAIDKLGGAQASLLWALLSQCWSREARNRPSASEVQYDLEWLNCSVPRLTANATLEAKQEVFDVIDFGVSDEG